MDQNKKQPAPGLCEQVQPSGTDPAAAFDPAQKKPQKTGQNQAKTAPETIQPGPDPRKTSAKPTKRRPGRPTKYKRKYARMMIEYFDQSPWYYEKELCFTGKDGKSWSKYELYPYPLRFISGFAALIGVTKETVHQWKNIYPEFSDAYARAKDLYKEHLAVCGSMGLFNANFTQFLAKNTTDWTDRQQIDHGGHVETTMFFENMLNKAQEARQWDRAPVN